VPDGLGALGLVELGDRVLEPDMPLGPQSVMAVRELLLAPLLLVPLPAVPALSRVAVEPALPPVLGAFADGLPESQSMLLLVLEAPGAPPAAFGLVLVCAMAVPSINATTDAAVRIVRCIHFLLIAGVPQGMIALRPLFRKQTSAATVPLSRRWRCFCGARGGGEIHESRRRRARSWAYFRSAALASGVASTRLPPRSGNSNMECLWRSATLKIFRKKSCWEHARSSRALPATP
jgi:hypothetical protein